MPAPTETETLARKSLVVNPAKTCQPLGAVYASMGIHGCMPHCHGSQGCVSYLRMHLSRHFRDPVLATGSSFTEGTAVFGGASNLRQALNNLLAIYQPQVVAVHTTCSTETIGDDVPSIVETMRMEGEMPRDFPVVIANTPSYVGSHITGFANMARAFAGLAAKGEPSGRLNVIPGFVEPGDVWEIKRILALLGIRSIIFPDPTNVVDAPLTGRLELYPKGGTRLEDVRDLANSRATLVLGREAGEPAAGFLEREHGVPAEILPTPIGIAGVDRFVERAAELAGVAVPEELEDERGRLVDMMVDAHPHFHGARVAIYGDPDVTAGLTSLVLGLGMEPAFVLTGTKSEAWAVEVGALIAGRAPEAQVLTGADLYLLHQKIAERPVDLLIGNSYGKFMARAEDIPLVRVGFPILDRANLHHFPTLGYAGAARLVAEIGNTLLDRKDRDAPDEMVELVM